MFVDPYKRGIFNPTSLNIYNYSSLMYPPFSKCFQHSVNCLKSFLLISHKYSISGCLSARIKCIVLVYWDHPSTVCDCNLPPTSPLSARGQREARAGADNLRRRGPTTLCSNEHVVRRACSQTPKARRIDSSQISS